ncbi:MAG: ROK family protein [Mycoplasmataceae bacterium]|nr:ROK family protein [Mycoplasmataceae bacterium]
MKKYISIDIGGTNARIAYWENGEIISRDKFGTNPKDPKETLDKLVDFINQKEGIEGVGISIPGPLDFVNGYMVDSNNMKGWNHFKFIEYMKEKTSILNIKFQNDANLMALANHYNFKQNENDITQFFTVSTGLGAGLIINNKIFTGNNFLAQEVDHLPSSWKNEGGNGLKPGSVELYASGSGISFRAGKDAEEVFSNKEEYKEVIQDGIEAIANLIATTCALINPTIIVFDGSVAIHNKWYIDEAIELSKERMFKEQIPRFEFSTFSDDSGLIGAYRLVEI